MTTYAPPDYETTTQTYLLALMAGRRNPSSDLEFGPYTDIVKSAEKKFISAPEGRKGVVVQQWLRDTIRLYGRDAKLEALLGLDCTPLSPEQLRANAGAYLRSLARGVKPDIRPEFSSDMDRAIVQIESAFDEYKTTEERVKLIPRNIKTIGNVGRNTSLRLYELLTEQGETSSDQKKSDQETEIMPPLPERARLNPELAKDACPLADEYVRFSSKASNRAFKDFHIFAFLTLVAAVIAGRAFLQIKQKRFYPNLMIIFCAETSFYAKSFTMSLVKNVLRVCGLGYRLGPNRVTPQKLLSDLSGQHIPDRYAEYTDEEQERFQQSIASPGQKTIIVDEAGLLFNEMFARNSSTNDFVDILLELYDCPPEYENRTVIRGGEPIERPCVMWQGNCTPTNAKGFAKPGSPFWGTGLGARCNFVVAPPPQKGMHSSLDEDDDDFLPIPETVINGLKTLHYRLGTSDCELEAKRDSKGEPTGRYIIHRGELPETSCFLAPEARQAWRRYRDALEELSFDLPQKDFVGSYTRLPDSAMRIAVILACINGTDTIDLKVWAKAQELAELLRRHLHELHRQVTITDESAISKLKADILEYLATHPGQSVSELQQRSTKIKNNRCADAPTIKAILLQLEADEIVESSQSGRTGRKKIYSLAGGNK